MSKHLFKRGLFIATTAILLSTLICAGSSRFTFASSESKTLAVLFTNDTNGYLDPCG